MATAQKTGLEIVRGKRWKAEFKKKTVSSTTCSEEQSQRGSVASLSPQEQKIVGSKPARVAGF
jgi:hypothetical protein